MIKLVCSSADFLLLNKDYIRINMVTTLNDNSGPDNQTDSQIKKQTASHTDNTSSILPQTQKFYFSCPCVNRS